ncbi:MAG TPA: DUF4012 domain-containing protein [Acidimicrobiales bacterium]|nr:DUF4012 domain-containing protein [Acidimicrobiales bacterium]
MELPLLAGPGGFAAGAGLCYAWPGFVGASRGPWRRAVVAAAAVGGAASGTAATGVAWADALLAAAVAATFTTLGARLPARAIAAVAVATALASLGSPAGVLALAAAAAGMAAAVALAQRFAPGAAVLVAGAAANAVLRLQLPGPVGTESAIAVALVGAVVALGASTLPGAVRRRAGRVLFLGVAATTLASAAGAVGLALARPSLERGAAGAGRGLAAARAADQPEAARQLAAAEAAFDEAGRTLGAWWVQPARLVPLLGPHVRALGVAARTGRELSVAGGQVAAATDLDGVRIRDGRLDLAPIRALQQPLADTRDRLARSLRQLRAVRSVWLAPPVARRLDANLGRLAEAEGSLRTAADVVTVLPALLGGDGGRRWFLAVQTPSEARATGGFIGNFGEISAVEGDLALTRFGRIGELGEAGDPGARTLIGPPDYVARYERFEVATTWQSVNLSPDFPSVAHVIAELYPQSGGAAVDGVIAIDPAGFAALLQLTGPLSVPAWPEPLTAENAEQILLYEQYVAFGDNAERVDFLGDATEVLWARITTGDLPPTQTIVDVLGPVVAEKHLLVSSRRADEDRALRRAGLNGEMRPVRGDALAVTTQNASGNKIDWFLRRSTSYEVEVDPHGGALTARLRVELRNDAPSEGLPDYLIGNLTTPRMPKGTSRLYFSAYSPWNLTGATIGGSPAAMTSEVERGRRVYSTFVDVPPGATVPVEMELTGRLPPPAPYHLHVHAQPLVHPDEVRVSMSWRGERPVERRLAGASDDRLDVPRP